MSEGWIKLHRQLQDNPIWKSEPFTRGQAWVDLILLANHEPGFIYVRDHRIDLKRGDVGWSQNRLSKRWQWSRTKIRKFLNDLEKEQQIKQVKSHSYTVIRLINYKEYQRKEQQEDNRKTTERQQKDTNKNDKNVKNDKKKSAGKPAIPSLEEVKDYFTENGYDPQVGEKAFGYYQESVNGSKRKMWRDSKGNPIRNWKMKMRAVWFKPENELSKANQVMSYHQDL